jgi:hypothetical protein
MKTDPPRCSEFLGLKVPPALADAIRRAARRDDRSISGFCRRALARAVRTDRDAATTDRDDEVVTS